LRDSQHFLLTEALSESLSIICKSRHWLRELGLGCRERFGRRGLCLGLFFNSRLSNFGVCNRLNLALADNVELAQVVVRVCGELGIDVADELPPNREWASEPGRVGTITLRRVNGVDEALRAANEETSGLAATIVTEDRDAARPCRRPR